MPTTTNKKVTMTANSDGSFSATVETDAVQTVSISQTDMITFIQSKDVPTVAPTA